VTTTYGSCVGSFICRRAWRKAFSLDIIRASLLHDIWSEQKIDNASRCEDDVAVCTKMVTDVWRLLILLYGGELLILQFLSTMFLVEIDGRMMPGKCEFGPDVYSMCSEDHH